MTTFGWSTVGTFSWDTCKGYLNGCVFTCSSAGTLTKITAYITSTADVETPAYKVAIYKHSDSTLVAVSDEVTTISSFQGWKDFTFTSPPDVTAQDYVLVISGTVTGGHDCRIAYEAEAGYIEHYQTMTYPTFPSTASFTATSDYVYYIYVTYTESGGATNTSINIGDVWKEINWPSCAINIGDTWKEITNVSLNVGDVWKDVYAK